MKQILLSRDSKSKCRITIVESVYDEKDNCYRIYRHSGLLNGKLVPGPVIEIFKGKSNRTLKQQNDLQYNSLIKGYLDKGYKTLESLGHQTLDTFNPEKDLPANNTNQQGIVKPMLCGVYDPNDAKSQKIRWLGSVKIDGLRAFIYMKDGELRTSSRGGQNYDVAMTYILQDPYIKQLLTNNPELILDGEVYKHGWTLQKISGLGRLESLHEDHKQLRFYCYDIVDLKKPFKDRLKILKTINPPENSLLTMVDHVEVQGDKEIVALHDKYVAEGYEGLVIRDPDQLYKPGSKGKHMLKRKVFIDSEFKVIGFSEGLREEDFVFKLITEDGKEFEAKPIGDRALKKWYREHMDELIGEMATVKYFHLTPDGIPNLPVLKSFRIKKDI